MEHKTQKFKNATATGSKRNSVEENDVCGSCGYNTGSHMIY